MCNPNLKAKIPRDPLGLIQGDSNYPLAEKHRVMSLNLYDALFRDENVTHAVGVMGSYHTVSILTTFVEICDMIARKKLDGIGREDIFSFAIYNPETAPSVEVLEKLAITEVVHKTIQSSAFKRTDMDEDVNFEKYAEFIQKYEYDISYEKLAERNADVIISPDDCGADRLIFGQPSEEVSEEEKNFDLAETIKFIQEQKKTILKDQTFEEKRFKLKKTEK